MRNKKEWNSSDCILNVLVLFFLLYLLVRFNCSNVERSRDLDIYVYGGLFLES